MSETPPLRGYAICTAPRSGSNFLCELLTATGELGRPLEYFNGPGRRRQEFPDYPDDPEQQLAAVLRLGVTANGIYGLKVFATHFDTVRDTRWAARLPNLRFIYLRRRDLLGQAISYARAMHTGRYKSTWAEGQSSEYDAGLINNNLVTLVREHARWQFYFARNGVQPLELWYEDVQADPHRAIAQVAGAMGLERVSAPDPARLSLQVQRDETSEAWRQRFLNETVDLTAFH